MSRQMSRSLVSRKPRCQICRHADCARIEMARLAGVSLDNISKKFNVGRDAIWRHMEHLPPDRRAQLIADVPMQELVDKAAAEGLGLIDYLSVVRSTLMSQMLAAAACNDRNATANLAGQTTNVLREIGKLTGELLESARSITNIQNNNITQSAVTFMASPLFGELERMLMRRLSPYPDALRSVVEGLAELEASAPALEGVALPAAGGFHADAA